MGTMWRDRVRRPDDLCQSILLCLQQQQVVVPMPVASAALFNFGTGARFPHIGRTVCELAPGERRAASFINDFLVADIA